jgi:dihydroorotate dehydrogenase (NAD+) catalytic subunit
VIGCGGVDSADAALAMIMAGAAAVEVGASLFAGFGVLKDIHEGLEAAVARWGVKNVSELVGKARETR